MLHRLLVCLLVAATLATAVPARAQVEPALPSWNWDNPTGDYTPWAPSTVTVVEAVALALAVDLFFGGRVSGALYRAALTAGRGLMSGGRAAAPAAAAVIR
jgi:hypothetical protein